MGYKENEVTQYKVGDVLYGKNSINIKVITVHATGAIDIQLITDQPGQAYYYFSGSYRTDVRKEPDKWLLLPNDKILRNVNMCTQVQFKLIHDTVQTKECSGHSWWGNLYGNDMFYGDPPYGHYYIPKDTNQTVPIKDQSEDQWRKDFGLGPEWKRVPGSYKWFESGNVGDYYGWIRKNNYGPYLNRYSKRFTMTFSKGSKNEIQSGYINIDKIKVAVKTYIPEPIDGYVYRTPLKSSSEVTYQKLTTNASKDFIKIAPYPAVNKFSIPNDNGDDELNFAWTSKEDEDDSKNTYSDVTCKFTDGYTGEVTQYTVKGTALTGKLTESFNNSSDVNVEGLRLAGKYEFEIKATFDGKSNQATSQKFIVLVEDDGEPVTPIIVDKNNSSIQYNMKKEITTLDHTPRWDIARNHTYTAVYDYYQYENDGYDCKLVESKIPFKNGAKTFNADGQYHIKVTATYRNGKSVTTQAVFMIDKRLPARPIIIVNNDQYEGLWLKDEASKKTYLNNAIVSISSRPFTRNRIDIYFKKMAAEDFQRVGKDRLPSGGLFNRIGTWKIVARSEKTEVQYPDGSKLMSDASEVIFAVKKKYTNDIVLTTYTLCRNNDDEKALYKPVPSNKEGSVKGYKVEARINFMDSLADTGNLDMRYILDENGNKIKDKNGNFMTVLDYTGLDSTLNKLYKIDGGEWKYYLDKIYLYNNCTIECKSVDDDGFESYPTVKKITTIDSKTIPVKLKITNGLENGNVIETGNRIIIG